MNHQNQGLLSAIKTVTLNRHLASLLQLQHQVSSHQKRPFELYQYEQLLLDYEEAETKMRQDILFQLNQHLYKQMCSRLQMELFSLQGNLQMEENQIELLKLQIEAYKNHARRDVTLNNKPLSIVEEIKQVAIQEEQLKKQRINEQGFNNSYLSIYPCVRVDFEPHKQVPRLPITANQDKQMHPKSHRQLLATYTKRSQGSNIHRRQLDDQENNITIKQAKSKHQVKSLAGIEHQMAFIERAWKNAQKEEKKTLCKGYKKQLMDLVAQFWREI